LREYREQQAAVTVSSSAKMTFGEALAVHLQKLDDDVTIIRRRGITRERFSKRFRKVGLTSPSANCAG
jgi:hypothetical protein